MASLLQQHFDRWKACEGCDACQKRKRVVLIRGTVPAGVLFVGEAPGPSEDVLGRPFVGPAGHLLDKIVEEALEGRELAVAYTNLVACIPLDEAGKKFTEPPKTQIDACEGRLRECIELCQPKLIVMVGKLAEKYIPALQRHVKTVAIVHPAAILRADISQRGLAIKRTIITLRDAIGEL